MAVDYRRLCIELFGTDDENEIRKAAGRKAGRKRALREEDIAELARLQREGMTVAEIAARFGVSRQTISAYLNRRGAKNCRMRLNYMYKQKVCTVIHVDFLNKKITAVNRTDDILHRAFGAKEQPDWEDFEYFLTERCFPEARGRKKELLEKLSLDAYDPLSIIERTSGRMAEDSQYIQIYYYGDHYENSGYDGARPH